ncbi:MAG: PAS domain S-box protein [SAR202 cluster bacterium]|nr:PAS domain S-box protein [SAR202 cluster bacterium]
MSGNGFHNGNGLSAAGELPLDWLRTDDGVFAVDAKQHICHWGASARAILGHAPEDVLGRPCYEVMSGVDPGNLRFCRRSCPIMVNASRGRTSQNYDLCTLTSAGAPVWLNVSILVIDRPAAKGPVVLHLFRDVTERRQVERAAHRAAAELRGVASDGLSVAEVPAAPVSPLTQRESEVLRLLACGAGTRRIATLLGVSPITARNHITNLLVKLGAESRLQAVVYASQRRLI